jgi:osmotically-inducible protein OsmY
MINTLDKTDIELKNDVLFELTYEPSVNFTDIGILVKDGLVILNGYATSYIEKWSAINAVKRVTGVKAITDEIEVKIPDLDRRTDADITLAAIDFPKGRLRQRIAWFTTIPLDTVEVIVSDGWVSLAGEVEWWYQQNAAINLIQQMLGVTGVSNGISVKPKAIEMAIEKDINLALKRSAIVDVDQIQVQSEHNKVVLRGKVRSFAARDEAERIAWSEPGVYSVDNHLGVNWSSIVE